MAEETLTDWLRALLAAHRAVAGSVHLREGDGLALAATVNIPEKVQKVVAWVPNGKGMAGLAMARNAPVQTCNLQSDDSADVKPGAKAVDAQGAVAVPVRDSAGEVRAVVGLAWADSRQFDEADLIGFVRAASNLPD